MQDALTIHEAAETTGWSARMLRYIERAGLVEPQRSASGYRLYGPAELQRLRTLRELLGEHDISLGEVGFALRLRREQQLSDAVEAWFEAEPERPEQVPATTGCAWSRRSTRSSSPPDPHEETAWPPTPPPDDQDFKVADLSPRRLRPQGDPPRRARDARPHGAARGVRRRSSRSRARASPARCT